MSNTAEPESTPEERRALFRVVRGEPDDAELAVLTVVLAAAASAAGNASEERRDTRGRSVWADRAAMMRNPLRPGPDAWRNSVWPR